VHESLSPSDWSER
jgi:hypothetical protein